MYCVKCGVKLADTEKVCPLCMTKVYHPDMTQPVGESLFPASGDLKRNKKMPFAQIIFTSLFIISACVVIICDIQFSQCFSWSLYVLGALMVCYVAAVLPAWFSKPEPAVFVPCSFAAIIAYLLLINILTGGAWFMSFAFPVAGATAILTTAVTVLLRYVRRGRLYILGGALIAFGAHTMFIEFMLSLTFASISFAGWSLYPLTVMSLLGLLLLFLAVCRPARQTMERKLFF